MGPVLRASRDMARLLVPRMAFRHGAFGGFMASPETPCGARRARHGGFLTCTGVFLWPQCAYGISSRLRAAIGAVWRAFWDMARPLDPRLADRDGAFSFGARPETARGARRSVACQILDASYRGVFLGATRPRHPVGGARSDWGALDNVVARGVGGRLGGSSFPKAL